MFIIGYYNCSGSFLSVSSQSPVLTPTAGTWVRNTIADTVPAGAASARLTVQVSGSSGGVYPAVNDTLDVSAAIVNTGSTVYPYRDGDSVGWSWTGTAHASTSTGPIASGATY